MKKEELFETLGELEDDVIRDAKKKVNPKPFALMAAALAAALLCGVLLWPGGTSAPVALAAYEPDYSSEYDGSPLNEAYLSDIRTFAARAGKVLLNESDSIAYSPTALYTALSMVAELTDGDCLDSLLATLEAENTDELREYTGGLWRYLCSNPDMKKPGKVTIANSLWLNRKYTYNGKSLQNLADYYYVASYTGDMQKEIPRMISDWVKKQTNNLLDCKLIPEKNTMAVLLSAIYFYDDWAEPFHKADITDGRFENPEGEWIPVNYMNRMEKNKAYYQNEGVTASVQYFKNGGKMLFILPDEGKCPADILSDTDLIASLLNWEGTAKNAGTVEWYIPRFTLSSTIDLKEGLTALGLGEFFDTSGNPLSKLSDDTKAYIGKAEQGTSVSINEKGCEAASYVKIEMEFGAVPVPPSEEIIHMSLTRPFVFAILSENDVPLFLGVVNNPNG